MRIFQNFGLSRTYAQRFAKLNVVSDFAGQRDILVDDRYGASHLLAPVFSKEETFFFTSGDVEKMQRAWAKENGLPEKTTLPEILIAQIEQHKTEVFYNLDPGRYDGTFVRRLPQHVKRKICWRAAPGKIDFSGYDFITCSFPSMRKTYEEQGNRTVEFFPAHDPVLDGYATNSNRDIDVLFFGGFSRHHMKRTGILEAVAKLSNQYKVVFHLDNSRFTRLAETPLGWFGPLAKHRRPSAIMKVAQAPVFGRAMYEQLGRAKIVINASIDMAGDDRGNMRCYEAMGGGAMLLTDVGNYPHGMVDGETMSVFNYSDEAVSKIEYSLSLGLWQKTASNGNRLVKSDYSKAIQFSNFCRIAN